MVQATEVQGAREEEVPRQVHTPGAGCGGWSLENQCMVSLLGIAALFSKHRSTTQVFERRNGPASALGRQRVGGY